MNKVEFVRFVSFHLPPSLLFIIVYQPAFPFVSFPFLSFFFFFLYLYQASDEEEKEERETRRPNCSLIP